MMRANPIDGFRDAIRAAGLSVPEVIEPDGKLHRFPSNGKRGDTAGWYVLHCDGVAAGIFGDWRSGYEQSWREDSGRALTPEQAAAQRAALEAASREREQAERLAQGQAAASAERIWAAAQPASSDHGYLRRKRVQAHGTRAGADGRLLVPMRDTEGRLWNIERIEPEKPTGGGPDKKGLFQGRRSGCYFGIGALDGSGVLCVAEGFATAASVHEATGLPVAVAFSAGNLEPVARALRKKYPELPILICADDDWRTDGNPGRAKAEAAALAVGGATVTPIFPGERPESATDFNDLHQIAGLDAVRLGVISVAEALASGAAEHKAVPAYKQPRQDTAGSGGAAESNPHSPDAQISLFPADEDRPCYVVLDDWAERDGHRYRPGVYLCGMTPAKNDGASAPFDQWICSPLYVEAVTFDEQGNNFGRLLRFKNSIGQWRFWAMPMELLRGSGDELRGELLSMGVELDPFRARQHLPSYLQRELPRRRVRSALQVGWAGKSFVLPDKVIGPDAAAVIFQSAERGHEEHTCAGTLEGWREGVSAKACGNPLLLLAISAAFAGPMLWRCGAEGGGLHLVGDSSTGKTSAIEAACSVWGGTGYRRSWRATANGMEGAAALFNDCLLALDEISECDPKEIGAIVYALGNGRGKQRASRTGAARGVTRWRCLVLSSGERGIATAMAESGHRAKAGQSVRLLDIPVARRFGAWDELHGAVSAAALSDGIRRASAQHHGLAGRAFLERLTHDDRDFCAMLEEVKALPMFSFAGGEGQERRAAARLALIGLGGELATEYGLTGWDEGEPLRAAAEAYRLWRSQRGPGNDERRQVAERLQDFIERHGDGRFSDADSRDDVQLRDRAGWWRDTGNGREYLLNAGAMREALKGHDFNRALDTLQEIGALQSPGADGKRARLLRIGGHRPVRLYPINPEKLSGGDYVD